MQRVAVTETQDLILRRWRPEDREQYDQYCNTDEVMAWLGKRQTRAALDEDVDWFEAKQEKFGFTYWVVERKSDQVFIGWCGLIVLEDGDDGITSDFVGELEIGWRFRADVWGLGYAKQSAAAAMDYAFEHLKATRVVSRASQGNTDSLGLMMRLGMRHEFTRDYGQAGDWRTLVYALDRDNWDRDSVLKSRRRA
jgi:RimJ/RimL family protein N-acetyltransferase